MNQKKQTSGTISIGAMSALTALSCSTAVFLMGCAGGAPRHDAPGGPNRIVSQAPAAKHEPDANGEDDWSEVRRKRTESNPHAYRHHGEGRNR